MNAGVQTIIYPVKDLAAATVLYGPLFGEPLMDQPYYVGYRVAGQDVGLDPNGHAQGMTGALSYWHVDGGKLIASVTDADGDSIGLIQRA